MNRYFAQKHGEGVKYPFSRLSRAMALAALFGSGIMPASALEQMRDGELAGASGASGIVLEAGASRATMDNLYWQDNASNASRLNMYGASVTRDNTSAGNFSGQLKLNQGSSGSTPALSAALKVSPFLFTSQAAKISYGTSFGNAGDSIGGISLMSVNDTLLTFKNTQGVFNANGSSELNVIFNGLNVFLGQAGTAGTTNQLVIGDIFGNVLATGKTWVDKNDGLRFAGNVLFNPTATRSGLEVSAKYRGNISTSSLQNQFAYNTFTGSTGGTPIIRAAMSGMVPNTQLYLQGLTTSSAALNGDRGLSQSLFGDQSLALRVTGEMGRSGTPFSWQIGEAGDGNQSIQFANMVPFSNVRSTANATFDSGAIYLNQIQGSGQTWGLAENAALTSVGTPSAKGPVNSRAVLASSDFQQSLPANTPQLAIQLRGTEWQGVAQTTNFVTNGSATSATAGQWALAPLLYGVDGNISLNGASIAGRTAEALQARFQLQTRGLSADNTRTTSLLLVDTSASPGGQAYNRYLGLRNIDAYVKGEGQVLLNNSNLQLNLTSFLLGFDTQLAAGYLPGAQIYTATGGIQSGQSGKTFGSESLSDVFYGVRGRMEGNASVSLNNSTTTNGALVFNAAASLKDSSFLHLVEPTDSSVFGLDKISGSVQGNNLTTDLSMNNGTGSIGFSGALRVNPNQQMAGVLKVGEVNLYPKGSTTPQKLMEIAIPGGQIEAAMRITPR